MTRSVRLRQRRRLARAAEQFPDLVELIVIAVRAGSSPTSALCDIADVAPTALRPALGEVRHRLQRGVGLAEALVALTEQLGPSTVVFVDAFVTADRYGLAITPVLDRLADDIRLERRRIAERQARTLPIRLSFPLVVCTLPSFVLLAIVPALMGALSTLRGSAP